MATEFGTFPIDGHIQRADGSQWSLKQDREFLVAFLDWLEKQGLGFGGALGNVSPADESDPL